MEKLFSMFRSVVNYIFRGANPLKYRCGFLTAEIIQCCLWNKLFKKEQTIADLSAVVTGVLIAYNVPVTMPIWQLLIGDFIAVIIVKMLFGGLGCNFVNPALVGRLAMMLSFTESMTDYLHTVNAPGVDLLAGATPLAATGLDMSSFMTLFLGNHGGVLGETCALALLIGGVYLVVRGVIKVTIPAENRAAAEKYTAGNGEVVAVRDCPLQDINLDFLADTLRKDGWGRMEIDVITRALDVCGLRRQ